MPWRNLLVSLFILGSAPLLADEPSMGPVIDGYGPTYPIENRDVVLPDGLELRAVFDIAQDPEPGTVNRHLVSVARYLNMHARNGVPVDDMHLAVVVHGPAVKNLLNKEGNPNLALIGALQAAGVQIYLCGQSMAFGGIAKNQLADGVQVALSAMTMLTILQTDDYALLPWGA